MRALLPACSQKDPPSRCLRSPPTPTHLHTSTHPPVADALEVDDGAQPLVSRDAAPPFPRPPLLDHGAAQRCNVLGVVQVWLSLALPLVPVLVMALREERAARGGGGVANESV